MVLRFNQLLHFSIVSILFEPPCMNIIFVPCSFRFLEFVCQKVNVEWTRSKRTKPAIQRENEKKTFFLPRSTEKATTPSRENMFVYNNLFYLHCLFTHRKKTAHTTDLNCFFLCNFSSKTYVSGLADASWKTKNPVNSRSFFLLVFLFFIIAFLVFIKHDDNAKHV